VVVEAEVETEDNADRTGRIKKRPLQMNHIHRERRP